MACPVSGKTASSNLDEKQELDIPVVIFETIADPVNLREISKEPIFLLGGQYAILIQFAHPGLAQGSAEHSDFAGRIMNRLKTTARFLSACVYGTPEEKAAIFSVIHRKHSSVKGEGYFADDPELHKWTAATLFMSLLVVHRAIFGEVPLERQEQLFRESAVYATSLRMPTEMWPKTLDDFWVYWNDGIANLPITPWAKSLCRDLMYPRNLPLLLRMNTPLIRLLTAHWLPERLRNEYGFEETPARRRAYGFWIAYIRIVYKSIPKPIRTISHGYYLKDMQDSAKRIQATGTWLKT